MDWKLKRVEGTAATEIGSVPGDMSIAEVETTLQRLVCTRLQEPEIIAASLRKGHGAYSPHLERVGEGETITFGHGDVHYLAVREAAQGEES